MYMYIHIYIYIWIKTRSVNPTGWVGLYTIFLLPILYSVWHTKGRSSEGCILPNSRAIVLQQCGQCRRAGRMNGRLTRARTTRGKTMSCNGQGVGPSQQRRVAYTYTDINRGDESMNRSINTSASSAYISEPAIAIYMLGGWVNPDREQQSIPPGHASSPPKYFFTPTAKARPDQATLATSAEARRATHRARPRSPSRSINRGFPSMNLSINTCLSAACISEPAVAIHVNIEAMHR